VIAAVDRTVAGFRLMDKRGDAGSLFLGYLSVTMVLLPTRDPN